MMWRSKSVAGWVLCVPPPSTSGNGGLRVLQGKEFPETTPHGRMGCCGKLSYVKLRGFPPKVPSPLAHHGRGPILSSVGLHCPESPLIWKHSPVQCLASLAVFPAGVHCVGGGSAWPGPCGCLRPPGRSGHRWVQVMEQVRNRSARERTLWGL